MNSIRALGATLLLAAGLLVGTGATVDAAPTYLPPYDGPGEFQTNQNPDTSRCWHRDADVVLTTPIWNLDPINHKDDYTRSIGTVELWYSKYCQTNWIVTNLPEPGTIYQHIHAVGHPKNVYTEPQTDTATRSFSLMVYAPGETQVGWQVDIWRNKLKVGWTQGGCGPEWCGGM
ncbi:hypothetical protein [Nocardia asiatica]|uniref:hypothetical protein n=1 Tax=Nocardia asiatica TaxID=209252 RepID=UPI003EE0F41C